MLGFQFNFFPAVVIINSNICVFCSSTFRRWIYIYVPGPLNYTSGDRRDFKLQSFTAPNLKMHETQKIKMSCGTSQTIVLYVFTMLFCAIWRPATLFTSTLWCHPTILLLFSYAVSYMYEINMYPYIMPISTATTGSYASSLTLLIVAGYRLYLHLKR